jgi:hypothetical protein
MIRSLRDHEAIAGQIFAGHVPCRAPPADPQTLALANGVERQPTVPAEDFTVDTDDLAGDVIEEAAEELGEAAFADEADARAVLAGVVGQPRLPGDAAYLRFLQVCERENRAAQGALIQEV